MWSFKRFVDMRQEFTTNTRHFMMALYEMLIRKYTTHNIIDYN